MNNTVFFGFQWMEVLSLLDKEDRNTATSGIVAYQITGTVPGRVVSMAASARPGIEVGGHTPRSQSSKPDRLAGASRHLPAPRSPASP